MLLHIIERMKFVDEAYINVKAGKGGDGCISFRREKFVPRGGPDGGNGGNGGSVYVIGDSQMGTLFDLKIKPHYRAGRGGHGRGKKMNGKQGSDTFVSVPLGVVVSNGDRTIGEVVKHGQNLLVARGGKGGRGNACFVSSTNRSPRQREEGMAGDDKMIKIVLKLISDIGLVGPPNSGKSTLLHALTNACPKIGGYPFTTLSPNLGVLQNDVKPIVIADMPGIVEGAHCGRGLGHLFLRHIERTHLIVIVVDSSAPDPLKDYRCIIDEFSNYGQGLSEKKRVVVFNKIDLLSEVPRFPLSERTFYISAMQGTGVEELAAFLNA